MSWFKLDDKGAFHPKVIRAGNEAYGAWCRAGQWASDHLTNGFVPDEIALLVAPAKVWEKLRTCGGHNSHGLVEVAEGGWQIHDFLDWNPTAEAVLERRKKTSDARRGAVQKRWNKNKDLQHTKDTKRIQNENKPDTSNSSNEHTKQDSSEIQKGYPVPVSKEKKEINKERQEKLRLDAPSELSPQPELTPEQIFDRWKVERDADRMKLTKDRLKVIDSGIAFGDPVEKIFAALDQLDPMNDPAVLSVFKHWQETMGTGRSKLDRKRASRIRARLDEGTGVETLCKAISGAATDPWIMGTGPNAHPGGYRGIETVLRDAAQVEKFLARLEEYSDDEVVNDIPDYEDNDPPGTVYIPLTQEGLLAMLTGDADENGGE